MPIPRCQGNPCINDINPKTSGQKGIVQMISFQTNTVNYRYNVTDGTLKKITLYPFLRYTGVT